MEIFYRFSAGTTFRQPTKFFNVRKMMHEFLYGLAPFKNLTIYFNKVHCLKAFVVGDLWKNFVDLLIMDGDFADCFVSL